MMNMKQAAEQVLVFAEKKGLKDVDVVAERSEALDVEIQDCKVQVRQNPEFLPVRPAF